jgi:hypothetical protein
LFKFTVLEPPEDILRPVASNAEVKAVHLAKAPLPNIRIDQVLKDEVKKFISIT